MLRCAQRSHILSLIDVATVTDLSIDGLGGADSFGRLAPTAICQRLPSCEHINKTLVRNSQGLDLWTVFTYLSSVARSAEQYRMDPLLAGLG